MCMKHFSEEVLISIVIPVYQVKEYLEKCIDSVIHQTYENLEIILVDDGSTDGSEKICDDYQEMDARISVVHKENGGLVSARKCGVNKATGEYLCYVDADDWIEDNYVAEFAKHIADDKYDIIWSLTYYKDYQGGRRICGKYQIDEEALSNKICQKELYSAATGEKGFQNEIPYSLWAKCFRSSFIRKAQNAVNNKVAYDEDFYCNIRCMFLEPKVCFVKNDGYHYLQRGNSIVHKKFEKNANKVIFDETMDFIEKNILTMESVKKLVITKSYVTQIYHGNMGELQKDSVDYLIPYRNAKKGKNIILYGMGSVGQSLAEYFRVSKVCNVIGCIDKMQTKQEGDIPCYELNEIARLVFDYVLITTIKMEYIEEIREILRSHEIPEDRIAYFDADML